MSKHTQGELHVNPDDHDQVWADVRIFQAIHWPKHDAEANAAELAHRWNAFPDLLAACKRIANGECTCADGGPGFQCDVCEAKAALAAAEGR